MENSVDIGKIYLPNNIINIGPISADYFVNIDQIIILLLALYQLIILSILA